MAEYPTVSVIVLNWNGRAFLADCLTALQNQDYPRFEIILVDNASTDDSVAFVRTHFPDITIHVNQYNLGFAAGNNVVLREVTADIAVLLNPDVVVRLDWLRQLVEPFLADPAIGIAGCKLFYPDQTTLNHAGGLIHPPQAMPRHVGGKETDTGQYDAMRDVEYVIGAAMAIRSEILPWMGLFDEDYFLYYEDVDLCFAARRAGYRVVVVPQAVAIHVESAVSIKGSFSYLRRFHFGRWRFLLKHYPPETILTDTFPAEQNWLAAIDDTERLAAAFAYEAIALSWPSIWQARAAIDQPISPTDQQQVQLAFSALQECAWQPPTLSLAAADRPQQPQTEERPSVSTLPLIGPLLARLHGVARRHRIASTEPTNHQQTAVYQSILQQQMHLLRELAAAEAQHQQEIANLHQEIGRLHRGLPEQADNTGN